MATAESQREKEGYRRYVTAGLKKSIRFELQTCSEERIHSKDFKCLSLAVYRERGRSSLDYQSLELKCTKRLTRWT